MCHNKANSGPELTCLLRLPQRSRNIAWMLSHQSPTLGTNVETTFPQHCLNVVSKSVPTLEVMLPHHPHNVAWTLSQCRSPTLGTNVETTFTQRCLNIVSVLVPNIGINVATTFTQCYVNIVSMSLPMLGSNVATTLPEHFFNVGRCWQWALPQCWGRTNLEATLAPMLWQCCHNVGMLAGLDLCEWGNLCGVSGVKVMVARRHNKCGIIVRGVGGAMVMLAGRLNRCGIIGRRLGGVKVKFARRRDRCGIIRRGAGRVKVMVARRHDRCDDDTFGRYPCSLHGTYPSTLDSSLGRQLTFSVAIGPLGNRSA